MKLCTSTTLIKKSLTTLSTIALSTLVLGSSVSMAEDTVLVTVNGDNITESQLEIAAIQSKINYKEITAAQKKLLTAALINRQLVLDEAVKAKFDKTPGIVTRVKALTESYIAANYLASVAKKFNIDEAAIKAYYDKNVVANATSEYKARHILVKTEDEAKALIKELEAGAEFSKLAKEKSTDTGSGSRGGDLGWFGEQDMVAPFSQKVASLKKGELSKTAVNSQFGWHVIILDDKRTPSPPKLAAVKQEIEKVLVKKQLNKYLDDLNASAKITLK